MRVALALLFCSCIERRTETIAPPVASIDAKPPVAADPLLARLPKRISGLELQKSWMQDGLARKQAVGAYRWVTDENGRVPLAKPFQTRNDATLYCWENPDPPACDSRNERKVKGAAGSYCFAAEEKAARSGLRGLGAAIWWDTCMLEFEPGALGAKDYRLAVRLADSVLDPH